MALDQLNTPTVRPPTSLDMLDESGESDSVATPSTAVAPPSNLTPPSTSSSQASVGSLPSPVSGLPGPNVSEFAQNQMANPSRWNLDMVRQGVDLINSDLDFQQERGTADMDEFFSSRGLVGSSVETQGRGDFLSQLDRTKSQRMFDLTREMANTFAQDTATAGNLGLGARAQELQAMGMARDDAYRYAVLEQSSTQFSQQLGQQESQFARQFGLSGEQLQLESQRVQQGDRSLSIQEANAQAEINLRAQQLVEERRQFDSSYTLENARLDAQNEQFDMTMAQSRDQFAQRMGLDVQTLNLQRDEMLQRYADNAQNRMLQMNLQSNDQLFQAEENRQNRMLEDRALSLQQAGLDAETAWREADRILQGMLESRALDLEAEGMARDEAYRQASIALDREGMAQRADIANQQASLSAQDIYLRALAAGAGDELPNGLPPYTPPVVGGGTGTGGTGGYGGGGYPSYDPPIDPTASPGTPGSPTGPSLPPPDYQFDLGGLPAPTTAPTNANLDLTGNPLPAGVNMEMLQRPDETQQEWTDRINAMGGF